MSRLEQALFTIGDYSAGGAVGAVTAVGVRAVVSPQLDMALAMLVGMAIGMIAHLVLTVLLAPVLDAIHVMVPGGLIGMYGGMIFAMRDTMQPHASSLRQAILVGMVFGVVLVAGVHLYGRAIRDPVLPDRAA